MPWGHQAVCAQVVPVRIQGAAAREEQKVGKEIIFSLTSLSERTKHARLTLDNGCHDLSRLPASTGERGDGRQGAHPAGPRSASPPGGSAEAGQVAVTYAAR